MKSLRMLFVTVVMMGSICIAQEENESNRIEELGHLFHYGANSCKSLSPECKKKLENVEVLAATLTTSQVLEALNYKVDGKDAIDKALSQECVPCNEWASMLIEARNETQFIVNELRAGHLTKKDFLKDDQLANKLHDFNRKKILSILSKNIEFAANENMVALPVVPDRW